MYFYYTLLGKANLFSYQSHILLHKFVFIVLSFINFNKYNLFVMSKLKTPVYFYNSSRFTTNWFYFSGLFFFEKFFFNFWLFSFDFYINSYSRFFLKWNQLKTFKISNYFYNDSNRFNFFFFLKNCFYVIKSVSKLVRFWFIPLFLALVIFYFLMYIRLLNAPRHLFAWSLILTFIFTLFSGFVFFIKKYRFAKYTSSIQQFWKRSYMLFWLIEGGLFLVFIFLTLNATEEPVYMFDQIKMHRQHLFSWRLFLLKAYPNVCLILLTQYLLYSIRWSLLSSQSFLLFLITFLLLQVIWLEFYQFYHIIHFYSNGVWKYKTWNRYWVVKREVRRTRLVNNYVSLALMLKFWHLLFILGFWLFFVLRASELNRVRYSLLAANNQNFILMYIMCWLYMYPWIKFLGKKFLNRPYYWFFYNMRTLGLRVLVDDCLNFYLSFFKSLFFRFLNTNIIYSFNFFYWIPSFSFLNVDSPKKWYIRDYLIFYFSN